jgi:hypothetical protein
VVTTVPRTLTAQLIEFCRTLSSERPLFIRSRPSADAKPSACFDNVARKIERAGGAVGYGWAIWNLKGVYFEAEHHGVWRNRHGELIDVSPQIDGARSILFLPDSSAIYDPLRFRSNVMHPEGSNPLTTEFVELARARTAINDTYRAGGVTIAAISPRDQVALMRLEARITELWQILTTR